MLTVLFGLLGTIFVKLECEPAPLLLGFVLGPMMEENLRRALLLSRGDPTVFFTRPLSLVMLLMAAATRAVDRAAELPQDARSGVPGRVTRGAARDLRRTRTSVCAAFPEHDRRPSRPNDEIRLEPPLPVPPPAGPRAQRRRHVAAARGAGRHRDAPAWRQCGGRRAGDGHRPDGRRAVQQRHRQRSVRDPLGWPRADRAQCVGAGTRRGDPAALRRPGRDSTAQLGGGDDSRRGLGVGRAVAALRHAAIRRPLRAGHTLREGRLCGVAGRRGEMGGGREGVAARPWLRRAFPAPWAGAVRRRDVELPGDGADARKHRRDARQRLLSRRACAGDGRARKGERRPACAVRFRRAHGGLGRAPGRRLRRDHRARDSAQRTGDRGAHGARHPARVRPAIALRRTPSRASTCRSRR